MEMERNGGKRLKNILEENLEKLHKVVRSLRERGGRLISNSQQLSDDDVAFWSFVKPDQRPKTVTEAYTNQD